MDLNAQLPPIILTRKKKEDPFSEVLRRTEVGKKVGNRSEVTGLIAVGASRGETEENVASGGGCSDVVVLPSTMHRGVEKNQPSPVPGKLSDANKVTPVQLQGGNGLHCDGLNIPWREQQQQGAGLPKMDGRGGRGTEGSMMMRENELKLDPRSFMAHDLELLSPMHNSGRMVASENGDSVKYSKSGRELSSPGAFWQSEQVAFERADTKLKKDFGGKKSAGKVGKTGRNAKIVKDVTQSAVSRQDNKRTSVASLAAAAGVKAAEMSVLRTENVDKKYGSTEAKNPESKGRALSSLKAGKARKMQILKRTGNTTTPKKKVPRGVPDHVMAEIAATPPGSRPKRCGYCKSCLNPARKKACEVIRSLGTNPPIPRGKNRITLLGEDANRTISKGDACLNKIQDQQHKTDLAPSTTGIQEKKRKVAKNEKAKENSEKKCKGQSSAQSPSKKSQGSKKKATENDNAATTRRKKSRQVPKDEKKQRSSLKNRCGQCKACLNPSRKKACESIRAMGMNPPIPRGKNRIAVLGEEAAKMTISKSSFSPLLHENIAQDTKKLPENSNKRSKEKKKNKQTNVPRQKKTEKPLVEELQLDNTPANGNEDTWTLEQIQCLRKGWMDIPPHSSNCWQQVADQVPGRNAAECFAKICEQYPAKGGKSAKRPPIDLPGPRKKQQVASEKEEVPKIDQNESKYRKSRQKFYNDATDEECNKKQQIDQILQQRKGLSLANRNQELFIKSNTTSLERPHTTDIRQIQATIAAAAKEFEIQGTNNQSQPDVYYWDAGVQFEIE
eukprot:jgi/Picsp_1/1025/NSC_04509-R1_hypothetical protein VOLCADRAFT_93053 [Volvox carteri f. nagariensis]